MYYLRKERFCVSRFGQNTDKEECGYRWRHIHVNGILNGAWHLEEQEGQGDFR